MSAWPDEIWTEVESSIRTPRQMLERLTWQMSRYESFLATPGLDLRSSILITEKLDKVMREFRLWFQISEIEVWHRRQDAVLVHVLERLDDVEAQQQRSKHHVD